MTEVSAPMSRESISLCMVVHDEAETLENAIKSVEPLVDEIIIGVDKKCKDKTPEIARKWATDYFEFDFNEDFAGTRNKAIKRAHGSLILILDGHEFLCPEGHPLEDNMAGIYHIDPGERQILTSISYIEQILDKGFDENFDVACFNVCMNVGDDAIPSLFFLQPRLFRNNGKIKYKAKVHNHLEGYDSKKAVGSPEVILIHNMPPKREARRKLQRKRMNLNGLRADIAKDKKNTRPYFYMGNSYADMGEPKKAIWWYEKYMKMNPVFGEEKYQALQQLGLLYLRHKGNNKKAREYLIEAMQVNWRRREPYILLAEIAFADGQWEECIHWLTIADNVKAPYTVMFCQGSAYTYMPIILKMKCYENLHDWHAALRSVGEAMTWRPGDMSLLTKKEEFKDKIKLAISKTNRENFLILDHLGSFTGPLSQYMVQKYHVSIRKVLEQRWQQWADFVWCEWADQNLLDVGIREWDVPVVCRLHSYEAFGDLPANVNWTNIDHLIFVADHIKDLFIKRWPKQAELVDMSVIPNGVQTDRFSFRKREGGRRIASLGYLNEKKNIPLLMECARLHPDYEFHIAGQFQGNHLAYWWQYAAEPLHNVYWYGWIDDQRKDEWLNSMDYVISTSIVEGFGFSIAEAMCKGIKPLLYDRQGAIWPEVFKDATGLRALLEGPYDSEAYRDHIVQNYSIERQMVTTDMLVEHMFEWKQGFNRKRDYERLPETKLQMVTMNDLVHA